MGGGEGGKPGATVGEGGKPGATGGGGDGVNPELYVV